MKTFASLVLALACVPAWAAAPTSDESADVAVDALYDTVAALDAAMFDAFNRCSTPEQLRRHASYFAPDVEFYHDTGGVTWSREAMLANTREHACGHFSRELVPGTLRVYPIHGFGAIEQGTHRFCQTSTGRCDGVADFTIVWRRLEGRWQVTRVLSYGHLASL
ncbi:nuclear transport factor 2 family protein [Marilutibacter aestuarii]|uniref:Nuclear transport factor 2 family protein n=1 Tax=Marilutibacter aestuarii TaxID=1706195 RepID=A0A508AC09_9GAMM|nr:nuclear transport factor 2 family protein [Lysobacter aestuarii]TQD43352.1 nuclear transport factor 2 family protein [Lysobacter aestuarii]